MRRQQTLLPVLLALVLVACRPAPPTLTSVPAAEQPVVEFIYIGSLRYTEVYRFVDTDLDTVCWILQYSEGVALSCLPIDRAVEGATHD